MILCSIIIVIIINNNNKNNNNNYCDNRKVYNIVFLDGFPECREASLLL